MRTSLHVLAISSIALAGVAAPAHDAWAQGGRVGIGPLVGSAPGADVDGARVPTVGAVGDVGLLSVGRLGLHLGGTMEYRAGAQMTGVSASLRAPLFRGFALRVGAAMGGAEVRRASFDDRLFWRDWRGVDAGIERRFGRTTGALMVRGGTIDRFAPPGPCEDANNCALGAAPGNPRGFVRVSFESRYSLF
jgi:hypothetical protein